MEKPRIVFHILIENRYEVGLIEQTLQGIDYDASFVVDTKETLKISENDLDILLLEPSVSRWAWLDLIIKLTCEYPDLPVILYSREITVENDFQPLSEEAHVFLVSDVIALKDKLGGIIESIIRKKEELTKKILFVDDDPNILNSYTRILRKTPWEVLTAPSAKKALEILQKEQVHLVVTDIKMPQIHGIELISKIRKGHKKLPIVICSAYPGMKDDHELQFHKVAGFLEKPVDPAVLKGKLKELLR